MDNNEAIGLACQLFKLHAACKSIMHIGSERPRIGQISIRSRGFETLKTLYILLVEHPEGVTCKQLANAMRVSQPVISIKLDKLVEQGLVKRRENPKDRRSIILTITEKAHEEMEAVAIRQGLALAEILAAMPDGQKSAMQGFIESTKAYFKKERP